MKSDSSSTFTDDKKTSSMHNEKGEEMLIRSPPRRSRPLALGFVTVALCYILWTTFYGGSLMAHRGCHKKVPASTTLPASNTVTKELVPLEAHIMSKCPDAKDCLRELVLPTMQRVIDKVNFTLSYIGT